MHYYIVCSMLKKVSLSTQVIEESVMASMQYDS